MSRLKTSYGVVVIIGILLVSSSQFTYAESVTSSPSLWERIVSFFDFSSTPAATITSQAKPATTTQTVTKPATTPSTATLQPSTPQNPVGTTSYLTRSEVQSLIDRAVSTALTKFKQTLSIQQGNTPYQNIQPLDSPSYQSIAAVGQTMSTGSGLSELRSDIASGKVALSGSTIADSTLSGANITSGSAVLDSLTLNYDSAHYVGVSSNSLGDLVLNPTASSSVSTVYLDNRKFIQSTNENGNISLAIGYGSQPNLGIGDWGNVSVGYNSLHSVNNNYFNTAVGSRALYSNIGNQNTAFGFGAASANTTAGANTVVGTYAMPTNQTGSGNTIMGQNAGGYSAPAGSSFSSNSIFGYQAGLALSTGSWNTLLGASAGNNLTTGNKNIIIGYNISATSSTATNSLNIGNLLFGTGIDGTGTTLSTGNIGVGTSTPFGKLSVNPNGITGPSFVVGSSTKTDFIVTNGGNVGIGTSNPTSALTLVGDVNTDRTLEIHNNYAVGMSMYSHADASWRGPILNMYRSGGTQSAPTVLPASGGQLGYLEFYGYDGDSYDLAAMIMVNFLPSWSTTSHPTDMIFSTTPVGATSGQTRLNLTSSGDVYIGGIVSTSYTGASMSIVSNKVGIGSSTPWGMLSVNPTALGSGVPEFVIGSSTATHFLVNGAGNVGIGTANPTQQLEISQAGGANITWNERLINTNNSAATGYGQGIQFFNSTAADNIYKWSGIAGVAQTNYANNTRLAFYTQGDSSGVASSPAVPPTEKMTILGSGNVGIGSTSPSTLFAVGASGASSGGFYINSTTNVGIATNNPSTLLEIDHSGGYLYGTAFLIKTIAGSDGPRAAFQTYNGGSPKAWNLGIRNSGTSFGVFEDGSISSFGTERFTILSGGSVGIGTTSPSQNLSVQGNGLFSGSVLVANLTATGTIALANTTSSSAGVVNMGGSRFIHAYGTQNTFLGITAGNFTTSGGTGRNTGIGNQAGSALVDGSENTLVGFVAGSGINSGSNNTIMGSQAGSGITSGANNTAVGKGALYNVSIAGDNTAIGYSTMGGTTGGSNVAIGSSAMVTGPSGTGNVAVGAGSAYSLGSGNYNVLVGGGSGPSGGAGDGNVGIGYATFQSLGASSARNVAIGYFAGYRATGSNEFYVGNQQYGSSALEKAGSLLYGTFNATAASQTLTINASTSIAQNLQVLGTGNSYFAGNVGVGTTSPAQNLSVQGSGYISSNLFVGGNITSTSSIASILPYASTTALTASGSTYLGPITDANHDEILRLNIGPSTAQTGYMSFKRVSGTAASYDFGFFAGGSFGIAQRGDSTTALVITSAGTANSAKTLTFGSNNGTISGTQIIYNYNNAGEAIPLRFVNNGTQNGSNSAITFESNSGNDTPQAYAKISGNIESGNASVNMNGGLKLYYSTSGILTEGARLTSSGSVGIGTTSPYAKLSVVGTVVATDYHATSSTLGYQADNLLGGITTLSTDVNGNIIRTPSDISLKENVVPLTNSLDRLLKLQGVSYDWKDKERFGNTKEIGFVAQQVESIVPEVVKGGSYKSLNYGNMVALVVEAVKELNTKVDAISTRLDSIQESLKNMVFDRFTAKIAYIDQIDVKKLNAVDASFSGVVTNDADVLFNKGTHFSSDVCVDNVCVTKDQFKAMLLQGGATTYGSAADQMKGINPLTANLIQATTPTEGVPTTTPTIATTTTPIETATSTTEAIVTPIPVESTPAPVASTSTPAVTETPVIVPEPVVTPVSPSPTDAATSTAN